MTVDGRPLPSYCSDEIFIDQKNLIKKISRQVSAKETRASRLPHTAPFHNVSSHFTAFHFVSTDFSSFQLISDNFALEIIVTASFLNSYAEEIRYPSPLRNFFRVTKCNVENGVWT